MCVCVRVCVCVCVCAYVCVCVCVFVLDCGRRYSRKPTDSSVWICSTGVPKTKKRLGEFRPELGRLQVGIWRY